MDQRHPPVRLPGLIEWSRFETAFGPPCSQGHRLLQDSPLSCRTSDWSRWIWRIIAFTWSPMALT